MAHRAGLVLGAQKLEDGQAVADGRALLGAEDRADLVGGAAGPALAGRVQLPRAVHAQMGVEGVAALDAGEQVLAAGVTSRTVWPVRSEVANRGTRRSNRVSRLPARAVCSRAAA